MPNDKVNEKTIERLQQKPQSYTVGYRCANCGSDFIQRFTFGTPARPGKCPHCGVSNQFVKAWRR